MSRCRLLDGTDSALACASVRAQIRPRPRLSTRAVTVVAASDLQISADDMKTDGKMDGLFFFIFVSLTDTSHHPQATMTLQDNLRVLFFGTNCYMAVIFYFNFSGIDFRRKSDFKLAIRHICIRRKCEFLAYGFSIVIASVILEQLGVGCVKDFRHPERERLVVRDLATSSSIFTFITILKQKCKKISWVRFCPDFSLSSIHFSPLAETLVFYYFLSFTIYIIIIIIIIMSRDRPG